MTFQRHNQLAVLGSALALGCYMTTRATAFLVPSPATPSPAVSSRVFEARRRHRTSTATVVMSTPSTLESVAEDASATKGQAQGGGMTEVLARKAKLKEVEALKNALPADHPIFQQLAKVGSYNQSTLIYDALKRPAPRTLSVIAEFSRKAAWGYLGSVLSPQDYSDVYREAGANVIAVNVDSVTGGCSFDDIRAISQEQAAAAVSRPDCLGAVPVISSDSVVDVFQVARAKLAGAAGVTIRFALNSKDTTKQLIDTCFGLGMEPVVQVRGPEEAIEAQAMGARVMLLIGAARLKATQLRPEFPEGVVVGYDLRRPKEYQGGLREVEDAWQLRDEDFHAVYAADVLWQSGLDDVTGPSAVIKALRAKACHWLVEPLDWIERCVMDGSKETLGELLM